MCEVARPGLEKDRELSRGREGQKVGGRKGERGRFRIAGPQREYLRRPSIPGRRVVDGLTVGTEASVEEFRKSWQRPKWHVLVQDSAAKPEAGTIQFKR